MNTTDPHIRAVVAACDECGRTAAGIAIRAKLTRAQKLTRDEAAVALGIAHQRSLVQAQIGFRGEVLYRSLPKGGKS